MCGGVPGCLRQQQQTSHTLPSQSTAACPTLPPARTRKSGAAPSSCPSCRATCAARSPRSTSRRSGWVGAVQGPCTPAPQCCSSGCAHACPPFPAFIASQCPAPTCTIYPTLILPARLHYLGGPVRPGRWVQRARDAHLRWCDSVAQEDGCRAPSCRRHQHAGGATTLTATCPAALPAGLHYDALAVAAYEGAPESLDVTVLPASGARTDMVMEVGGAAGMPRRDACLCCWCWCEGMGSVRG